MSSSSVFVEPHGWNIQLHPLHPRKCILRRIVILIVSFCLFFDSSAPTQVATQAPVTPWLPPNLNQRSLATMPPSQVRTTNCYLIILLEY